MVELTVPHVVGVGEDIVSLIHLRRTQALAIAATGSVMVVAVRALAEVSRAGQERVHL